MTHAHTFVAQACLAILLHLDENVTADSLKKFPLAEYAAEHWFEHARFEGASGNAEEEMKALFDGSKPHLAIWVWICDPIPWMRHTRAERPLKPLGSPLHYAAFCGLPSIVELLALGRPRDVRSRDFDDESTPLHMASRGGHVEVAHLLVEHGADVKAKNKDRWTPLHSAMGAGSVDLARFFVENGADVKAKDNHGSTPLHEAVRAGSVDLARFLVERGADVEARDNDGWTPLDCARHGIVKNEGMRENIARFLLENGDSPGPPGRLRRIMHRFLKAR